MKIKITGLYLENSHRFEAIVPKESLSESDAQVLLDNLVLDNIPEGDFGDNPPLNYCLRSTSDGKAVNLNTLTAELYDDEIVLPVTSAQLYLQLRRMELLDTIINYVNLQNGETKIWFEKSQIFDFYHPQVQDAINEIPELTYQIAKHIWKEASKII